MLLDHQAMNSDNKDYFLLTLNKAIDTIILGNKMKGDQILQELYNKQTDSGWKEYLTSFMNKNKEQLLNFTPNKYN